MLGHIISHFAARQNISLNNASFSAPLLIKTPDFNKKSGVFLTF